MAQRAPMSPFMPEPDPNDPPIVGGPAEPPVPFEPPGSTPLGGGGGFPVEPPPAADDQDEEVLPTDIVGDIPPPPIPAPPSLPGVGPAGIPGTEGSTFARPGSAGLVPFRTAAYRQPPQRFGPGVPVMGGGGMAGLSPDEAAELLRAMAAGRGGSGMGG